MMAKNVPADFENSTKCWICVNAYIDGDIKLTDDCHITGKYRGFALKDYNFKIKLNYKILVVFHNLKSYDSHHVMQEQGILNFKVNVIPIGMEKYMSYNINNKLIFIFKFCIREFI